MSIAKIAVNRPVAVTMIVIGLLVVGSVALLKMPLTLLPDLNLPAAAVYVEYPNVGPWEVEAQVTRPIEEVIATVSNVTRVTSVSETGSATIVAQFNWGTDMDFATLEMRERLEMIQGYLPDSVERPQVFKFDPSLNPIFQFNIGGQGDLAEMRRFAEETVKPRLERIEGVASVSVTGGLEPEIRVELDPVRMEQHNVTFERVQQALFANNLNLPVGSVTEHGRELSVRAVGEYTSLDEMRKIVVQMGSGGIVRLEDVATVTDTYKPQEAITRLNGVPSVSVSLQKESEANPVDVSDAIWAEVNRLTEEFGDTLQFQVVWDDAEMIRASIRSVMENALMGAAVAVLVLLLFLGSFSPTLVIGVAIPVSAIATFFFLYLFDISLNMISLGGLALGIGMLVDNAIVSLENIARHRQAGKDPQEASIVGTSEIISPLVGSTVTTIAVFLPVVFVGGLASEIFTDLSLAITFSLGISLVVAVTFVPMIATRVRFKMESTGGPTSLLRRLHKGYELLLRWALAHKGWVIGGVLLLAAASAALFPFIGQEFMPSMDTGQFNVAIRLPYGTAKESTDAVAAEFERLLAQIDAIDTISTTVSGERADLVVGLVPLAQREKSLDTIVEEVRSIAEAMPGAEIQVTPVDAFGLEGGLSADISLLIKGHDMESLARVAEEVAEIVRGVPGTREVDTSLSETRPELQIHLDRDRASQYGLTVGQVASTARMAVDGAVTTRYRAGGSGGQELDVTLQLAEEWREDIAALEQLLINTPLGVNVRLGDIASLIPGETPAIVHREGGSRVVRVYALVSGRDIDSVAREIEQGLATLELPDDISWEFGGDVAEMITSFGELSNALILAVILVYMILAAQFESFLQPLVIMFTVPLAFIGVAIALFVSGYTLNVASLIGLIMLVGIVVNNSIVMIDFINQQIGRGMERREAVVTGAVTRLRPVLMTTLTTITATLPMALGIGEGVELQAPLATVVVGGLGFSTVLTLVFIPVMHDLFGRWSEGRIGRSSGVHTENAGV